MKGELDMVAENNLEALDTENCMALKADLSLPLERYEQKFER